MFLSGAGADTTSIGMRTCLYYICNNSAVYSHLQKEIDDYYEMNDLREPISYTQALTLPYLQAVIKEATRLLPSIVYQLLKYVPAGGITVDGRFIPEGSVVGISPISQNRDKAIWGEDADVFRPERWIEDEARGRYLESMSMTFGGNGPRACIGKNIALVWLLSPGMYFQEGD
jgi:cytochrome P450